MPLSRSDLFDRELDRALGSEEVQRGLRETKAITQDVLRERCRRESAAMWKKLGSAVDDFDVAARRLERVEKLGVVGRWGWWVITSWRVQCSSPLVGVMLFVVAFLQADPGVSDTSVTVSMLLLAAGFLALAAATLLITKRKPVRYTPLMCMAIGVGLFYLGILRVVQGDQVKVVQGSDEASWLAVVSAFTGVLALSVLFAGLQKRGSGLKDVLGLWSLTAIVVAVPVGFFLVGQIDSIKVLTAEPVLLFVLSGEIVLGTGGLVALAGWGKATVPDVLRDFERQLGELTDSLEEEHLLPFLRSEIAKHVDDYAVALDVPEAPGISQVFDVLYRVPTASAARVNTLLEGMPGGSIGFAGSRGSGKTTLMESYCLKADEGKDLATMVAAPVEYTAREFLLHLYAKFCLKVLGDGHAAHLRRERHRAVQRRSSLIALIGAGGAGIAAVGGFLVAVGPNLQPMVASQGWGLVLLLIGGSVFAATVVGAVTSALQQPRPGFSDSLKASAADRLEEIRYQQSYTTTTTGTLKLPVGLEGARSKARGLTRQPMHLPEIVELLKAFLEEAARERGRVIIGIDELDKMKSETAAEQFLNEIKGIFGIKNVYFLVSVSEEAMSTFERRGLPFRDVFDSTFDEIVWFDHLSTVEATATIDRRVLVPIPFKQLCFTLSGGLPRDLIRVARMMLDCQEKGQPTSLSVIAQRLVEDDVRRKTRAVAVAARRLDVEPHVSRFLATCDEVTRRSIDEDVLAQLTNEIVPGDIDPADKETRKLCRLIGELAGFYYYAATLLEFFDSAAPDQERWKVAGLGNDDPRALGTLATARQAFAASPSVAWSGVSRFREAWGLKVLAFPEGLSGKREPSLNGSALKRLPFRRKQKSSMN